MEGRPLFPLFQPRKRSRTEADRQVLCTVKCVASAEVKQDSLSAQRTSDQKAIQIQEQSLGATDNLPDSAAPLCSTPPMLNPPSRESEEIAEASKPSTSARATGALATLMKAGRTRVSRQTFQ